MNRSPSSVALSSADPAASRAPGIGPGERRGDGDEVEQLLRILSDHPSASLLLNEGIEYFRDHHRDGLVAYRQQGSRLLQLGGVVARAEDSEPLLSSFVQFARQRRQRILAIQLREHHLDSYHRLGFRTNELGRSYTLDIRDYDLRGKRFMKLRNKLRQPRKHGIEVKEVGAEIPLGTELRTQLERVTSEWLRGKGRGTRLLRLLVGEIDRVNERQNRCFVAMSGERMLAFITYTAAYGSYPGYMHDLTRRVADCPPGVMELINDSAIRRFQSEGILYLNFGFTPFVGVDDREQTHSPLIKRLMQLLAAHGSAVYPAQSQVQYKMKWCPQIITPEFIGYERRMGLGDLWAILRATGTI